MKLCKDCRFCETNPLRAGRDVYGGAKCAKKINPVDGTPAGYCEIERHDYGWRKTGCGSSGRYWEPRA